MKNNNSTAFEKELEERLHDLAEAEKNTLQVSASSKNDYLRKVNLISRKPVSKPILERPTYWKLPILKELKMGTIATIMIILGLLLGGTTATAYAAQDALPTETLYPVKVFTEDIQADLTSNPELKLELALQFAETRINEITQLQEAGLMPPEPVYANLQMQIQRAIELATQLGEKNLEPALLQIRERLQNQVQLMGESSEDPVLLRTRTMLQERIQLVDTGLGNLNGFYFEAQNGWENTPLMNQGEDQQIQQQQQSGSASQNGISETDPSETPEPGEGNGESGFNGNPTGGSTSKTPVKNGTGSGSKP